MQRTGRPYVLHPLLRVVLVVATFFLSLVVKSRLIASSSAATVSGVMQARHSSPVMFVENAGQYPNGARFQVLGSDHTIIGQRMLTFREYQPTAHRTAAMEASTCASTSA
jgi:hypothetical protein